MNDGTIRVFLPSGMIVEHPEAHDWDVLASGALSIRRENQHGALQECVASYGMREWIRVTRTKGGGTVKELS